MNYLNRTTGIIVILLLVLSVCLMMNKVNEHFQDNIVCNNMNIHLYSLFATANIHV